MIVFVWKFCQFAGDLRTWDSPAYRTCSAGFSGGLSRFSIISLLCWVYKSAYFSCSPSSLFSHWCFIIVSSHVCWHNTFTLTLINCHTDWLCCIWTILNSAAEFHFSSSNLKWLSFTEISHFCTSGIAGFLDFESSAFFAIQQIHSHPSSRKYKVKSINMKV